MESYVRNSFVAARDETPIFVDEGDGVFKARLDGYVIVPKERIPDLEGFFDSLLRVGAPPPALAV